MKRSKKVINNYLVLQLKIIIFIINNANMINIYCQIRLWVILLSNGSIYNSNILEPGMMKVMYIYTIVSNFQ